MKIMKKLVRVIAIIIVATNIALSSSYASLECIDWEIYDEPIGYEVTPDDGGYYHYFKVVICVLPPDGDPNTPDKIGVKVPITLKVCEDNCDPAWPLSEGTIPAAAL